MRKQLSLRLFCLLAVAAALAIFAGCGGGGGGGSTESTNTDEVAAGGDTGTGGEQAETNGNAGESSNGATGGGEPPAREISGEEAKFIAKADRACGELRARITGEIGKFLNGNLAKLEEASDELVEQVMVPGLEEEIQTIQSLNSPASATEAVDGVVAALEQTIEKAEEDPEAFMSKGEAAIEAKEKAKELGFKQCGVV